MWFAVEVNALPADPIGTFTIECPVQRSTVFDLPIKNPTKERIEFNVSSSICSSILFFVLIFTMIFLLQLSNNHSISSTNRIQQCVHISTTLTDQICETLTRRCAIKHRNTHLSYGKGEITYRLLCIQVTTTGQSVTGSSSFKLLPAVPGVYRVSYAPFVVGETEGSVIFDSPQTGEFWYKVGLKCVSPPPASLPLMECQLGDYGFLIIQILMEYSS